MTERLIIRNFAGLNNIEIEISRINIFIGPQASGKSVCAKCLYWFKSFIPELLLSASLAQDKRTFDNAFINKFKEYFPGIWRSDDNLFLRYEFSNSFIQIEHIKGKLHLSYSPILQNSAKNIRTEVRHIIDQVNKLPHTIWRTVKKTELSLFEPEITTETKNNLYKFFGESLDINQLFIIAGRSFFSTLKGNALSFLANNPITDPFLKDFISKYERVRLYLPDKKIPGTKPIWELAKHILKGDLVIEDEDEFILTTDGRRVPLINASSGQQEVFSLILLLMSLMSDDDDVSAHSTYAVYVEEPEAHLFPESQRVLSQLMSLIYNRSIFNVQYFITTHSPYLLSSFNNLIYSHQLSELLKDEKTKLKELYKIIPLNQQLPVSDFRVYGLENGKAVSLIDQQTGLLSADLLDSASDITANQFGSLMNLDPTTQD